MNIEEAIKVLNNFNPVDCGREDTQAIETLLTAYEKEKEERERIGKLYYEANENCIKYEKMIKKEKEKNKTLEELLQGRLFELYKYYKDLASEYQGNCVSKDKIKPIQIIDLDGKIHNVYKIEEE